MSEELKGLIDEMNTAVAAIRSEVDSKANKDDVVTEEKMDKIANDVTSMAAKLQEIEAKAKRPQSTEELKAEEEEKQAKAFEHFLRTGYTDETKGPRHDKVEIEVKAMSTDVNPDGGYVVRPQLVDSIVGRVFETSPLRGVAATISADAKSIEMFIDDDENDANSVGEGSASSDTDTAELGLKVIPAHRYDAEPKITIELLEDAGLNIESWLEGKTARKISRKENTDFVQGNGVNKARGFMTYAAWSSAGVYERDKIEQVNLGHASALTADGLIELQNSLKEEYQPGATWAMKRSTFGAALKLKGNDNYFFSPTLLRDGQTTLQLLGKPVIFMDDMAAVAADALAIAYADFSEAYTIYDRSGLTILRDPYTSKGFVKLYTSKRTGGDVTSFDAIKIGKVAA